MSKTEITPHTNVGELLNNYPELEDKLIEIVPVFKKLKNPLLRRTVAKVINLKQAATIGGVPLADLINKLRSAAGLNKIKLKDSSPSSTEQPKWVNNEKITFRYDASEDIESGIHPAAKVTKEILTLNDGELYQLTTPFVPAPLIDIIKEKGFDTFSEKETENLFHTYIRKK